ncbi:MAG: glycosyltransferase [Lachnospiraceae bacterium]|nr:glycosyltransferase [Lachnospiraceae bacterium]
MNVASCLNEYYVPYTYMMMKSLFSSNKSHAIRVFLLHDGLSEEAKSHFDALAKAYSDGQADQKQVEYIRVENFSMEPKIYEYGGWNELTMYRLLLWDILPEDVDRVLHLDGDMIVNKDLSELYERPFEGRDLIACPDILAASYRKEYCIATHGEQFKPFFEEGTYINAGMLLMNVKKNRCTGLMEVYEKAAKELNYVLPFPDQDLLNYVHHEGILFADTLTYNFPGYDGTRFDGGFSYERAKQEVAIFHFLDKKPWNDGDHELYELERFFWDMVPDSPYEERLHDPLTVVIFLDNMEGESEEAIRSRADATKRELSGKLSAYFREINFLYVDPADTILDENADVHHISSRANLKNSVVFGMDFKRILFTSLGDVMGDIEILETKDRDKLREVILDEGISAFDRVVYPRSLFDKLGGFAPISCDEDYELVLRALLYDCPEGILLWRDGNLNHPIFEDTYVLYAYELISNREFLKDRGLFDEIFAARFAEAKGFGIERYFTGCVEDMARQGKDYRRISDATRPIAVFDGMEECGGALQNFAEQFGAALRRQGKGVLFLHTTEGQMDVFRKRLFLPYLAAVGFQTKIYGRKFSDGTYFGNLMPHPKFNFLFDHPIYMTQEFEKPIQNLFVLSQDETYAEYINERLPRVKKAYHFPPAGMECAGGSFSVEKTYDITFIGTYYDYRLQEKAMEDLPENYRRISHLFYDRQKKNPNERAEEALAAVFNELGYEVEGQQFTEALYAMGHAVRALMYYYREKVVETLLEGGIKLHVFSDTWKAAPFSDHENLTIHGDVSYEEGLSIMAKSRLSLNVMSWHKGGLTERLNNAMMNHSICVTDKTTFIEREYAHVMLQFDLSDFSDLSERVRALLADEKKRRHMALEAYGKANATQTWDVRAREFLRML